MTGSSDMFRKSLSGYFMVSASRHRRGTGGSCKTVQPSFDAKSISGGIPKEDFAAVQTFSFLNFLPQHVLFDEWFEIISFGDWCSKRTAFLQTATFMLSQPHPEGPVFNTVII